MRVSVGDGASMPAVNHDLEWQLRYWDAEKVRLEAAEVVAAYNYLIERCTLKEANRRLKILKKVLDKDRKI